MKPSSTHIRAALVTAAAGASLFAGGVTTSAAPATPDSAPTPTVAAPIGTGTTGSADSGSAGPGSIFCWLLHPSPTCQI